MKKDKKVVIVNFGMGNLNSVKRKLHFLNIDALVSADSKEIEAADKLILPGVGHFSNAMDNLKELGLIEILNKKVLEDRVPILGICLGMQLMAAKSEEGNYKGLGWFDAEVVKFNINDKLKYKIPQVGWNQIAIEKESKLMNSIPNLSEFYFVHSYHVKCNDKSDIVNTTDYENKFTSAIEKSNIYGVQYHPEKSHDVGIQMITNFIEL